MFAAFYHKNRVKLPCGFIGCFAWVTFRNMLLVIHYLNCKSRCSSCTTWEAMRLQNRETIAYSILKWNLFIMYWPLLTHHTSKHETSKKNTATTTKTKQQPNYQTTAQHKKTPTTKPEHSKTPANREKRKVKWLSKKTMVARMKPGVKAKNKGCIFNKVLRAAALKRTPRQKLPPGMKSKIHQENTVANLQSSWLTMAVMTVTAWGWIIDDGMDFAGRVALNCPCSRRSSNAAASAIANQPESRWNSPTRQVHTFHKWVGVSQNQIQHAAFPLYFPTTFPSSNAGSSSSAHQKYTMLDLIQQFCRSRCKTHQAVDDDLPETKDAHGGWLLINLFMSQKKTYHNNNEHHSESIVTTSILAHTYGKTEHHSQPV